MIVGGIVVGLIRRVRAWRGRRAALATAGVVVALDQVTKQLAAQSIDRGESVNVFFGLDLTNTRNTGVAFGALEGSGLVVAVLIGRLAGAAARLLRACIASRPLAVAARWGCCWAARSATWPTAPARAR